MTSTRLLRCLSAVALLAAAACQPTACLPSYCDDPSVILDPADVEPGPWQVGVLDAELQSRRGRLQWNGPQPVTLKVTAWYPSDDAEGAAPFCYDDLGPSRGFTAAPGACRRPRPVVLYTHGSGGVRWLASYLTEQLASEGYVVAAPDHTFNTVFDDDGSDAAFAHVVARRPRDVKDTFNWLVEQSQDEDSPLYGCVDERAGYAVIGHSYGGYTALALGGWELTLPDGRRDNLDDPRVWAVSTHAPWHARETLGLADARVDVPLLTLAGERDDTTTWEDVAALHAAVDTQPSYLGLLPDGGHYTFVPAACFVLEDGDGCGDEYVGEELATGLIVRATTAFLAEARGVADTPPTTVASDELAWDPPLP